MACINYRKNHRYTPTTYERLIMKYKHKKYDKCLECGQERPTTKVEDGEGCSRNGGYE